MKTYSPKLSELQSSWHVFDATGKTLGRLATEVAVLLQGKHKPTYASFRASTPTGFSAMPCGGCCPRIPWGTTCFDASRFTLGSLIPMSPR
ncbi:MAG: ribosomal protein [Dehalococcoidia bacterium]|nr:ribosomal protein [Dehalococcoidia bacterium]